MSACLHCGLPAPGSDRFCCTGCGRVYRLLQAEGLGRFHELRTGPGVAVDDDAPRSAEPLWTTSPGATELDVQGMHCAGCVWLLQHLYRRHGRGALDVSVALGRATLRPASGDDVDAFVRDAARFGYRMRPSGSTPSGDSGDLLFRFGVCVALAGNGMMYALAQYFGLASGPVHRFFTQLAVAAATLAVLVGGSLFIGRAVRATLRGHVSLDLPIALGIALAYAGMLAGWLTTGQAHFADSLTVFVALMVGGRWARERTLERDRARALAVDGSEHIRVRRVVPAADSGNGVDDDRESISISRVREGDRLWLEPGALVPVASALEDEDARFRLDWIDGESEPRSFVARQGVPAGAFLVSSRPVVVRAREDFEGSDLRQLLVRSRPDETSPTSRFWRTTALMFVVLSLSSAVIAALVWTHLSGPRTALEVATAILIVACPCAFGVSVPMAYELAAARLRMRGLFVRSPDTLDRVLDVQKVVLDKTGTLTTGAPNLLAPEHLDELPPESLRTMMSLAGASAHPMASAVERALAVRGVRPIHGARPAEIPGCGVQLEGARLGRAHWALGSSTGALAYADERHRMELFVEERLRHGAVSSLRELRSMGLAVQILSGDDPVRVATVAARVGVADAVGGVSPEGKAARIVAGGAEGTLFLGDGLNDGPAVDAARVSGCAALDRPFMAARADFFCTTAGVAPLVQLIETARAVRRVVQRVFAFSLTYNVLAIGTAALGWMTPWMAAIVMPLGSIASLTYVGGRLGPRPEVSASVPTEAWA